MTETTQPPSLLIVGGEASADLHGAKVLRALRELRPDVRPFGVGGEAMRAEGLDLIAPAEDMAVAGITEVLWALPRILGIRRRLLAAARERRPQVAVLIDHPDFNLRLAKKLKAMGTKVVYFISPQVWAWRQGRVKTIEKLVDKMMVILPFEEAFYAAHGVAAEFVGHPLVDELDGTQPRDAARIDLGVSLSEGPVVAMLPGSRAKEVSKHLPVMLRTAELLRERYPTVEVLIPIASTLPRALVDAMLSRSGAKVRVYTGRALVILSSADAAVVASGTASLQAGLLTTPLVVVYRVSWLTYQILRRMVKVAHIAMVNLIAGREVVPELIQGEFNAPNVYQNLVAILDDDERRTKMRRELGEVRDTLGRGRGATRVAEVAASMFDPSHQLPAGKLSDTGS